MKNIYLGLTILGFIIPNIFVAIESLESGNILLYANPSATIQGMFANRIATIFSIDLLFAVMVFFIWSNQERKKYKMNHVGWIWALTLLFGLAGGLPMFLYLRSKNDEKNNAE